MNGGTRKTMLQVTNAVLLPKLLFGMSIVNSGSVVNMKQLQPLYNSGIRESSGVFRSSPVDSIMAEAGQLPFEHTVVLNVVTKAVRLLERCDLLFQDTNAQVTSCFPSIERAKAVYEKLTGKVFPKISSLCRVGERAWNDPGLKLDWTIKKHFKVGDPPAKAQQLFLSLCSNNYFIHQHIFTDGSVDCNKVGFGVAVGNTGYSKKLPKECSIFSAEAKAIWFAITKICTDASATVIFTDSASVLSALEKGQSNHTWIQQIEMAANGKTVTLCWIPGHMGITGNERADALAKADGDEEFFHIGIPSEDAIRCCKFEISQKWENQWWNSTTFLRIVKATTSKWPDRHNASERRAISRLRIGHTRLTHKHLFNRDNNSCSTCGEPLTVPHILLDCRAFDDQRRECGLGSTIGIILNNEDENEKKLVKFLRRSNLLNQL